MTANFWGIEKGELATFKPGALKRVVQGGDEGTLVHC